MSWLETQVTIAPATEPVTLAQVKDQCRVDQSSTADDSLLNGFISAARQAVEAYCGIRLVTQTVLMRCSSFCDFEALPAAPLQSISSITYTDPSGNPQTLDPSIYSTMLYGLSPAIRRAFNQKFPAVLVAEDVIAVTAVAGFTSVPTPIIHAMLLLISQWYDFRTGVQVDARGAPAEIPNTVSWLLANFRR